MDQDCHPGQSSKRIVETQFRNASELVVSTTKPDKWDRYLAAVFLRQPDGTEIDQRNYLLSECHAGNVDKGVFADWGDLR